MKCLGYSLRYSLNTPILWVSLQDGCNIAKSDVQIISLAHSPTHVKNTYMVHRVLKQDGDGYIQVIHLTVCDIAQKEAPTKCTRNI